MKVLQINVRYNQGSTGKITADLHHSLLDAGNESVVLYGRGEKMGEPHTHRICSDFYAHVNKAIGMISGIPYGECFFSTNKIIRMIQKEKPDVVHVQCINGNFVNIYRLMEWLRDHGIKTVLTLHAEFMHTANCSHAFDCNKWKTGCGNCRRYKSEMGTFTDGTHRSWLKMEKSFQGFKNLTVVSVSPWLMERAKQSPFFKDKRNTVVTNGMDVKIFCPAPTEELRKQLGLEKKKILFHATPWFTGDKKSYKGGYYILELAKRLPDVTFVVAGNYSKNISPSENLILLGKVTDQMQLAKYYALADLTVITSKRETFSMIVAESLCCGTPVVGFKAGGPETIALKAYSNFVEYGNVEELKNAVLASLNQAVDRKQISNEAASAYSKESMYEHYKNIYEEPYEG